MRVCVETSSEMLCMPIDATHPVTKLAMSCGRNCRVTTSHLSYVAPVAHKSFRNGRAMNWWLGYRRATIGDNNTVQHNTIQHSTAQHDTIQFSTAHSTIQHSTVQYNTIQHNTIQYSTLQYNTAEHSTIQYSAMRCYMMCMTVYDVYACMM